MKFEEFKKDAVVGLKEGVTYGIGNFSEVEELDDNAYKVKVTVDVGSGLQLKEEWVRIPKYLLSRIARYCLEHDQYGIAFKVRKQTKNNKSYWEFEVVGK
jgi:hypothetical protein